jgi:hypothetical protein
VTSVAIRVVATKVLAMTFLAAKIVATKVLDPKVLAAKMVATEVVAGLAAGRSSVVLATGVPLIPVAFVVSVARLVTG